jgi:hypothetical protein
MKKIQTFKLFLENNNALTEKEVEDFLKENYTSDWFDQQLQDRVFDYISEEEAEDYDGDPVEAYKNLSTGGAVEWDLITDMSKDTAEHFSYDSEKKIDKRTISDICHDHLMDTCEWYDRFVFDRKSTEPYKSMFDRMFGTDWDGDIKL